MVYVYRVTLTGIKGFFRVYHVNSENTLYSFHKQMRVDMEFPQDQQILFKGLDANGDVVARYGLIDLGAGTVDEVTLAQTVKAGVASFVYFYDTTNKKSVNVTFEGEAQDESIFTPTLLDIKGPNPIEFENGYVAFEDLPDEQRHLPSESDKARAKNGGGLAGLLAALDDDSDDASSDGDDIEDNDIEDEEEDEDDVFEEAVEIYDGSEELSL
ncbi:MAG: hypothetical protein MJZ09_01940 [Bacteroidales bacterium]|nr:hypothetical protein [Bacteroidales bacterium]